MTNVDIEILGLEQLDAKLKRLGRDIGPEVKNMVEEAVHMVHSNLPSYPSVRPSSDYRRTGTLGRTITTRVDPKGIHSWEGAIGTSLHYAPWTISDEQAKNGTGPQAWFHRGRWYTLQDQVRRMKNDIINMINAKIRRLLGGS